MSGLNTQQKQAVTAPEGPALIVAGPGTGKTKTLTTRIAYVLEVLGADPSEIVALTFTNKAAREMNTRLRTLVGLHAPLPKVTTFHALGHALLQANDHTPYTLISEPERMQLIRGLSKPATFKGMHTRELSLLISRTKTTQGVVPDTSLQELTTRYEKAMTEHGWRDFDDLLCQAYQLLECDETLRPQYKYIFIDEFQDTNELQYAFLRLLGTGDGLFAIGDPNQSIYAFRGADGDMFRRFQADFPHARVIELSVNYRSKPEIVAVGNALFPEAPQLQAWQTEPGVVRTVRTLNEYSEAAYIVSAVTQGIGGSDMLSAADGGNHQPRDYAVVYRTHRIGKIVERALAESGIPYQVAGEGSPYERPDIAAVIGVLRYMQQPDKFGREKLAALAVLQTFRQTQLTALLAELPDPEGMAVCEIALQIAAIFSLGQGSGLQDLQQFFGTLVQFGKDLGACLAYIDKLAETEFYDPNVNAVTLLTIHASKGLEFMHVFVCAVEEGVIPKLVKDKDDTIEEERRLLYVAATRAQECLEILYATTRMGTPATMSRFIGELPEAVLPRTTDPQMVTLERRLKKRLQKRAQESLF